MTHSVLSRQMICLRCSWAASMTANIWHNWWLEGSWYFPVWRWRCHLGRMCSLHCGIVLFIWLVTVVNVKKRVGAAASRVHVCFFVKENNNNKRESGCRATVVTHSTECYWQRHKGKAFFCSVNVTSKQKFVFWVSAVKRSVNIHKSQRQATNLNQYSHWDIIQRLWQKSIPQGSLPHHLKFGTWLLYCRCVTQSLNHSEWNNTAGLAHFHSL